MRIFFLIGLIIFFSCKNSEIKKTKNTSKAKIATYPSGGLNQDSILKEQITDTLFKLAFVKKANAYIDSFSDHKHGIAFIIDPVEKNDTEIFVRAGYNGDLRFETYYQFYLNRVDLSIKIYDPEMDQKLPINEYINLKK